jgi:phage terminase large subunit GpA-like protein
MANSELLAERLRQVRQDVLKPSPKLTLVEWADTYRMLSPEASAEAGKWNTSRVPVVRGIMEAVTHDETHIVSVMCSTQYLKTELLLNAIGYYAHQDPAPMIIMQPTVGMAEAFSKDRVAPMFRDTEPLKAKLSDSKRVSESTILHKTFQGGHLTMVGSNSAGELAMRPVRIVLCDEVDKYPNSAGKEGDPIKLLSERCATFWNYKIIHTCSPTTEGQSRIAVEFENGDQRIFEPVCHHCGHRHELDWANVKWHNDDVETTAYYCPECGGAWNDVERLRNVKTVYDEEPYFDDDGIYHGYGWRGLKPFKGHASFRANKLTSPWEPLSKIVKKFIDAKDSKEMLKTFINTQLAQTWKEKGEAPPWKSLYLRREDYKLNVIPMKACVITAWADVQKDRIEVEIVAWAEKRESWSVDYRVYMGDTANLDSECYTRMSELFNEQFTHESGVTLMIDRVGIDSGYNTQVVYNWARQHRDKHERVMVTKGHETLPVIIGIPTAKDANSQGKRARRGIKVWNIGTNIAKSELYGFLRQDIPDEGKSLPDGWCHFPQYDEEYFRMLTAEEWVVKKVKGYDKGGFFKSYERNEALDCRVGNRALSHAIGVDRWGEEQWQNRRDSLGIDYEKSDDTEHEKVQVLTPKIEIVRKKSSYW